MSVLLELTEGWTALLPPFTLKVDNVPFPLTGYAVTLDLRKPDGSVVTVAGTITLLNQGTFPGQVTFQPAASDFAMATGIDVSPVRQTFKLHWKVTDGTGQSVFFPHGAADEIIVHRA